MKILSIQRIGRAGIVQYTDAEGKPHACSFDPALSDDQVAALLIDDTGATNPVAPDAPVTTRKRTRKK